MAGARQPTALVLANGKKHFTKAEIAERLSREVAPCPDDLTPPSYLTAAQKKHFKKLAGQLTKIEIMGETDVDTLARYVVAETAYQSAVKECRMLEKDRPTRGTEDYFQQLEQWGILCDLADKRQQRYFKQASTIARDLGLTISSRCKLVVPKAAEEEPKRNKFARFGERNGA